jgi:hypothetical protein
MEWDQGGWAAVDKLYREPLRTTREWLAEPGELEAMGSPGREELGADAVPVLPSGFALALHDEMGAWLLRIFLERSRIGADFSRLASLKLRGDVLSIHHDAATDDLVTAWRLRLADEETAEQLATSALLTTRWRVWRTGRDLVLMASTDESLQQTFGPELAFTAVEQP